MTFVKISSADNVETAAPAASTKAKVKPVSIKRKKIIKSTASPVIVAPTEQAKPANKPNRKDTFMAWLKDMKKKVDRTQARQNQIVAVAAVRGDETADSPPLYWKGKKVSGNVESEELKKFEEALDQAMTGDSTASKEKLESFITTYPNSPLVVDAKETLQKLDQESASETEATQ